MTKQQIYDNIVSLTAEIKATGVAGKLFEAGKHEDGAEKVKEVCENFVTENSILYLKMMKFASDVNQLIEESESGNDAEVFCIKEDEEKGVWVFDTNVINASSFFVLTFWGGINQVYLFALSEADYNNEKLVLDMDAYLDALEEESGSSDLANFLAIASFTQEELEDLESYGFKYSNFDDLLADVFAGKLKEYVG